LPHRKNYNREGFPIPRMTNAMLAANWLRGV
jgi:hypothetical protein